MTRIAARPSAEFLRLWEEGYVADPASFAMMHTQAVVVLEGGPLRNDAGSIDRSAIIHRIEVTSATLRESRSRLMSSTAGLTPAAWVPDEAFDIGRHVRFGDEILSLTSQNLPLLTGMARGPLSLRHPLWRATLTELDDGNVALGVVMHHVVGDALFTLKFLSALTTKAPESAPPRPTPTALLERAPRRGGELPWMALRAWASAQPNLRAGWRSFWSMPLRRRIRRVGARNLRPLRHRRAQSRGDAFASLPPRHADFRTMLSTDVSRRASEVGCTMSDLLIAAVIRSAPGSDPDVSLRIPIAVRRAATEGSRNSVVDLEVSARRDGSLEKIATTVRSQLPARPGDPPPPGESAAVTGAPIGYATLVPWLSRPRYFGRARVREIIAFPTGLASDELSTQAILYDEKLTVVSTAQQRTDVSAIAARLAFELTGAEHEPLTRVGDLPSVSAS